MNNRLGDPSEVSVLRWLCDKSLACSPASPPGRVPHVRGLSRTWVKHDLFPMLSPPVYSCLQEKIKERALPIFFNPCTRKSANMGHPSRGQGLVANRESGGRNDKLEGGSPPWHGWRGTKQKANRMRKGSSCACVISRSASKS